MKIEFHGEPVYGDNDKCMKAKIKIYGGNVNKNFQDKGMAKEKASCKCLSNNKKTKMENLIDEELEPSSTDDVTDNDFNKKNRIRRWET